MTPHVTIIGLGYVGLPLAVEFGRQFKTTGFDINERRLGGYKQRMAPSNPEVTHV